MGNRIRVYDEQNRCYHPKDHFRGERLLPSMLQDSRRTVLEKMSLKHFQATMWTLLSIALLLATCRLAVRWKSKGRLYMDDVFLIFANVSLVIGSSVLQIELATIYLAEEFTTSRGFGEQLPRRMNLQTLVQRYHLVQNLHGTLSWLTIFAVKFSFLFLFRQLVERIPSLEKYWKWILGMNVVACMYCLLYIVFECQGHDVASARRYSKTSMKTRNTEANGIGKCIRSSEATRTSVLLGIGIGIEILTDLLSRLSS